MTVHDRKTSNICFTFTKLCEIRKVTLINVSHDIRLYSDKLTVVTNLTCLLQYSTGFTNVKHHTFPVVIYRM